MGISNAFHTAWQLPQQNHLKNSVIWLQNWMERVHSQFVDGSRANSVAKRLGDPCETLGLGFMSQ